MSWVEYNTDDDAFDRRASWRRHGDSDSSDSAKTGLRKASHRAKTQVKAATNNTDACVDSRKSQIAIAAAIAAGLAIAGLVVSKIRGTKDRTAGSDREAIEPSVSEAHLPAATQPKKLAARRKRSGQLPEATAASSSVPSSPRHKHARHDNVEEPSTNTAPPAAGKASAQPAKSSRSKTITRGPSKRPALPSRDTSAPWSSSDQQGSGHASDQNASGAAGPALASSSSVPQETSDSKAGATPQDTLQLNRLPSLPAGKERALRSHASDSHMPKAAAAAGSKELDASDGSKPRQGSSDSASGSNPSSTEAVGNSSTVEQSSSNMDAADDEESHPIASQGTEKKAGGRNSKPQFGWSVKEGPTTEETKNSQVQESDANPASSSQTGSGRGKDSKEEEQEGREEEEQGSAAPEAEGVDEEGSLLKPAMGQEEDEGPEATEEAEQVVKEAAEAINKQLPKEAQGGSMQPLVEEKQEGEGQALDTFSAEIDALDQSKKSGDGDEEQQKEKDARKKNKGDEGGSGESAEHCKDREGEASNVRGEVAGGKEEEQDGDSQGDQEQGVDEESADKHQGEEEEEGKDKGGEDKPVVNPLEDKEPVLNPPEPVPVRLDSQPLESASSQGSAEGQEDTADETKAESAGEEVSSEESDSSKGQQEEASGQVKQKQPDLATVAEDDSGDQTPPPPLQRAPSPSASHSSTEGISPKKKNAHPKKKNADAKHTSAFGHADVQAQRAFSGRASDSGDLGKKPSASAYSGLNPTSTRSASRMLSDAPPPTSKKPSGPITKRDILANSILQMDMDHELDTFTADIDCLMDSSDEEAEEQAAAKGKKLGGEGGKGETSAGEHESGDQKKSKKGLDESEEDDEGEDDDAANVEDLGSPEQRDRLESLDDEEADKDKKKKDKEDDSKKPSAAKGNDSVKKDDDRNDRPEGGSGGGAAASGSSSAESNGKGDKAGGGKPSASRGRGKSKGKGKQGAGSSKGSSETRKGQSPEQAPSSSSASSTLASSDSANEGAAENPQISVLEPASESPEQAESASDSPDVEASAATGHSDQNDESASSSASETHKNANNDHQSVTQSASESAAAKRSDSAADSAPGAELHPAADSKPAEDATGSHAPEPHALNDASCVRPSPPATAEIDRDDVERSEPTSSAQKAEAESDVASSPESLSGAGVGPAQAAALSAGAAQWPESDTNRAQKPAAGRKAVASAGDSKAAELAADSKAAESAAGSKTDDSAVDIKPSAKTDGASFAESAADSRADESAADNKPPSEPSAKTDGASVADSAADSKADESAADSKAPSEPSATTDGTSVADSAADSKADESAADTKPPSEPSAKTDGASFAESAADSKADESAADNKPPSQPSAKTDGASVADSAADSEADESAADSKAGESAADSKAAESAADSKPPSEPTDAGQSSGNLDLPSDMCPEAASDASTEPSQDTKPSAKLAPKSSSQPSAKSARDVDSAAEAKSPSASASAADQAQDAESSESPAESATSSAVDAVAHQSKHAGTSSNSPTSSASESAHNAQPAAVSTAALSSDSGKQANAASEADPDLTPKSGEVADSAHQAAKSASIALHPSTTHLMDALDSELHSEVSQVATNLRAADAEFSAQGSVALPDLDTANRELEHGDSAESPRSPHTFGLEDMTQYADIDLTKDLNDPNPVQLVDAETDSESEQPIESSKDDSVLQIEQGDDTVPQIESPPVADLDDLHAETPKIIGSDAKYAPILSARDRLAKGPAETQHSSAQVTSKSQDPSTPELARPAHPQAEGASLSDSDSSGPEASASGSATAVGVQQKQESGTKGDEEQEDEEELVMLDMDFIQQHRDALASAPLVGDLAGVKAREEFIPSSKAEKHAARLHAEAGRLYNEEESKEQGERLQRQVLQYLVKQQAHPGMVSDVASNLGDMLWEQEKFEEAESVLDQARKAAIEARHPLEVQKLSNNLGAVQRKKLGKLDPAYEVHQEALMEALKAFGRASHYTLLARGQVVEVLSELDQQATAEVLLQEALDDLLDEAHARQEEYYKRRDVSSVDEESEEAKQLKAEANQACLIAARSSADLGKLHAGQGKDSEAEQCFQTALATVETVAGRGHPETAFALGAYASFLKDREDTESRRKAVELYKMLQRIMQQEHGVENYQNAMVLRVLSDTLESLQQYGEAAEYAQKSVKALGGTLGKDHPALESFWQAAADLLQKAGDKSAAKKAHRQAERIQKLHRKSQLSNSEKRNSMPNSRRRTGAAAN
ncbi:hypothetical protein WJX77_005721 [Trebouxia sp. C0004]